MCDVTWLAKLALTPHAHNYHRVGVVTCFNVSQRF